MVRRVLKDNSLPIENNEDLEDELVTILKSLVEKFEQQDGWVRKQQVKSWKKNDEFWHGVQFIFWSETRQDWVSPIETTYFEDEEGREQAEGPFYDYVVNFYRAHGESIIAALSAQLPGVRFPPDDADNENDIVTSKTFSKIADLIQRHNKAKVLFLGALGIAWNQGLICAYHAPKEDKAFGKLNIPTYKSGYHCQNCDSTNEEEDCPTCGNKTEKGTVQDGTKEVPKSRVMVELYGPLHVKVPYYAREQQDFEYLELSKDQPTSLLKSLYPHIADKIDAEFETIGQYERMARTPSSYSSFARVDENRDYGTLKRVWIRPWAFHALREDQEKQKEKLLKLFPDGCYVTLVGKTYAESRNEDMDKYWTVTKVGVSQYIHSDPMGQPLIPMNEMSNVLVNLTLETIEQSIPDRFADSDTLDFETYSRHEARPGTTYPVRKRPGERIADSFHEGRGATLSKEVPAFAAWLEKSMQFVVGSFPSIFGGPTQASSRTASEYNMSRQMAMQRLSIAWSFISFWWAEMIDKCVRLFVENMAEDEHFTSKVNENYQTVWIRQAELTGAVGEVEPESADTFPMSMPQKQSLFMQLLQLNNPFLNEAIFDSNNRVLTSDVLGFPEFEVPGVDQRIKQEREISYMMKNHQPLPIEPEIDDDAIHISTLKHFMAGEQGWDLKMTDPEMYQILEMHLQMHSQDLTMKTQMQFENAPPGEAPGGVQ